MSKMRQNKKGKWFTYTNKGHRPPMQWTVQGEPINNHEPRMGTVGMKKRSGCRCEYCRRNTKAIKKKIEDKEFNQEKREHEKN